MRTLKSILLIAVLSIVVVSCNNNKNNPILEPIEANKVTNLYAPQKGGQGQGPVSGEFTKFSFKEGKQVTGDNWDIAFRGLRIIVNGGSKFGLTDELERTGNASLAIVKNEFSKVIEVPADSEFKQDSKGVYAVSIGGEDWYTYNRTNHQVTANAGFIIVVKTIEGNYAKMEIRSYYKNEDISSATRYYTFDYVYNPNVGDKDLK